MQATIRRTLMAFGFLSLVCVHRVLAQETSPPGCSEMRYEHFNMVDYGPLRVSKIKGSVKDVQGWIVSAGCVGLFSEDAKVLVAWTAVAPDGSFEIPKVPSGNYKLIVTMLGFCTPNAKIRVGHSFRNNRQLTVVMKPRGIDECSWIEAK